MALSPISGSLGPVRAKHLLRRLTFGPNQQQVEAFSAMNIRQALDSLLGSTALPVPPQYPEDPAGKFPPGYEWVTGTRQEGEPDSRFQKALLCWWVGQMAHTDTALEKLVFFLHAIITTKREIGGSSRDLYWQNTLFRQYLINDLTNSNPNFNRYTHLIRKMMIDNSMLHYLDGRLNVKGRPNENFAREMFELFTIGKGPSLGPGDYTHYTEEDIRSVARVLTGWDVVNWKKPEAFTPDPDSGLPRGRPRINEDTGLASAHDNLPKTFSHAFGGHTIRPVDDPATPESMEDELRQLVDMIYGQEQAARFLCRRIYRFYVHWRIDDQVEEQIIGTMVQTFISHQFRLRPMLEQLFSSEYFFEAASGVGDPKFGSIIKSPLELTLGTLKYFNVALAPINTPQHNEQMGFLLGWLEEMGLHLMEPYDVAGYEAYHQAPGYNRNWITTNTLAKRYSFINGLLSGKWDFGPDLLAWAGSPESGITDGMATKAVKIGDRSYAMELIEHIAQQLLPYAKRGDAITAERYAYFAEYHLGGLEFDNWVFNWNKRKGWNADIQADATIRLRNIYNAIMQSPEYQLF